MTDQQYYSNSTNFGSYQYVSLADIVNNFMLMYVGDEMQVSYNTNRYNVIFHAKRGIQELNYDASREILTMESTLTDSLKLVLPSNYVNYVKVSKNVSGVLMQIFESPRANRSESLLADFNGDIVYDYLGNSLNVEGLLTQNALNGMPLQWSPYNYWGWFINDQWYFPQNWVRYGLNTEEANNNGTFRVDKSAGVMNFNSSLSGSSIVIEYISDGLSFDDSNIMINKLAEEYIYAYIKWALISAKSNVQEYAISRAKKDKMSALRNAKIRLSNMHSARLLMTLRGQDKWIK